MNVRLHELQLDCILVLMSVFSIHLLLTFTSSVCKPELYV